MKVQHAKPYGRQWKSVLRGKCIAVNIHVLKKKDLILVTTHSTLRGKKGETGGGKKGKTKLKATERGNNKDWRRENWIEKKNDRINEAKSQFFAKINETGIPLIKLTRKKSEMTQIIKIKNRNGDIFIDLIDEMDKFLERHKLLKLVQEKLENLRDLSQVKVIEDLLTKKAQDQMV